MLAARSSAGHTAGPAGPGDRVNNAGVSRSGHDEAGTRGADAQRLEVALATIKDMFGVDYPIEPGPGRAEQRARPERPHDHPRVH